MNLNKLAKQITLKEGKKKSMSIAQVKEVLRITLKIFSKLTLKELVSLLKK